MAANKNKIKKTVGYIAFIAYLIVLSYFLFFSEDYGRNVNYNAYRYNIHLFSEIKRFWTYKEVLGYKSFMINVFGNIAVFLPFGYFLPIINPKCRNPIIVVLLTVFFSFLIESIQLVAMVGIFDVDDLFLNTLGGFLGCLLYRLYLKIKNG
jgi:glycopeptide antibiotics resistance protein